MVTVTGGHVLVDGVAAGWALEIAAQAAVLPLPDLTSTLKAKRDLSKVLRPGRPALSHCLLQIDEDTPATVVKTVFAATAAAGYTDIGFLVHTLPAAIADGTAAPR